MQICKKGGAVPKGTQYMVATYPAIDMAGYLIKPLWGFVLQSVSMLL